MSEIGFNGLKLKTSLGILGGKNPQEGKIA